MSESVFAVSPIGRTPKASEFIASQLRAMILNGELKDGSLLPPETQLSGNFGVARPTLREAFRILETEGLIEVAKGSRSGAKVRSPKIKTAARYAAYSLRTARATLLDTYQAQSAIEPFAARLLAERRDPIALRELKTELQSIDSLANDLEPNERRQKLSRFHKLLVSLTGNSALVVMTEILYEVLAVHQQQHFPSPTDLPSHQYVSDLTIAPRSMHKLVSLIEKGDPDGTEAHWRKHLTNAAQFWLAGLDPGAIIEVTL